MGISGGIDSSTLLYTAVKYWNLKPLVIHFDNHWNAPEALHNMSQLVKLLGVDSITYTVNKEEYDRLNDAFLWAGTPDADIPNDIAMTKLMYDTAFKYNIKYILNGHDFRTEGSTPKDGHTWMLNTFNPFTTSILDSDSRTILSSHSRTNYSMLQWASRM
jgi:tRNA(Ile)-lysidine synthase TilS/MesJ